ncbi:sensor histidine kinase [uncultured Amphritea sp.]|uniref:sensor histidine kinase n=1 Tax=uncultured Amphritea sp. TaxID=981605 RepID=UPI0025D1E653|nr:sensor histidine kinase [uncultured Amphritea sp.]
METRENKLALLKEELTRHLEEDQSDNDTLLNLSHEIAALEQGRVRFTIDAGVIDRLGQELVARQETAVSELIKNAYDADATEVVLSFVNSDAIGGKLVIDDNGDGMTRDELTKGFMRISSTSKIHNPVSKKYKRQRAGQKGIGRFAVQRLGSKLVIITQTEQSDNALQLTVDWNDYQIDNNLISISNTLEIIEKQKKSGTTIIIEGLRDKWSKASIKRAYRYASSIILPIFPDEVSGFQDEDKGLFDVSFFKETDGQRTSVADKDIMIYDHAVATIEGHIDSKNGLGVFNLKSKHLGIEETGVLGNDPYKKNASFTKLRDVRFKVFYYIYEKQFIPQSHLTSVRSLLIKEGGVKVYRNGFRVLPYGEGGDDWLELDKSTRRRTILFPHANLNFYGHVQINDSDKKFNETSSREGLIENEEFRELKNFVHRSLLTAVNRIASKRGTKAVTNQEKSDNGWEDIELIVKNIALSIEELDALEDDNSSANRVKRKRKLKKTKDELNKLARIQKDEIKRTIKERNMLRVLSSVGLTVSQFIHEIKYYMGNIQSDIKYLNNKLDPSSEEFERVNILKENFRNFHDYTAYFNDVVSANIVRELYPQNIRHVVTKFVNSICGDAKGSDIDIEPIFNGLWLYTRSMHPSEWSSILFNLYTNSKKAIKRQGVSGRIMVECGSANDLIYLEFSDNGDGIKKENEDLIFDEFFTTTSAISISELDQNHEMLGTGLGLKIVSDIIKSYRGSVSVVSPKSGYSTCIRVEINQASEKELSENGL